MRNFQGIIFVWAQTYRETFKPALVYLEVCVTFLIPPDITGLFLLEI